MTDEQRARLESLRNVKALFDWKFEPDPEVLIALSEWVSDGSISAATAFVGHRETLSQIIPPGGTNE